MRFDEKEAFKEAAASVFSAFFVVVFIGIAIGLIAGSFGFGHPVMLSAGVSTLLFIILFLYFLSLGGQSR